MCQMSRWCPSLQYTPPGPPPPKNSQLSSVQERKSAQVWQSRRIYTSKVFELCLKYKKIKNQKSKKKSRKGILRSVQESKSGRISSKKVGRSWGEYTVLSFFFCQATGNLVSAHYHSWEFVAPPPINKYVCVGGGGGQLFKCTVKPSQILLSFFVRVFGNCFFVQIKKSFPKYFCHTWFLQKFLKEKVPKTLAKTKEG